MPGGVEEVWVVGWGVPQETAVMVRAMARVVAVARLGLTCLLKFWWLRVRRAVVTLG